MDDQVPAPVVGISPKVHIRPVHREGLPQSKPGIGEEYAHDEARAPKALGLREKSPEFVRRPRASLPTLLPRTSSPSTSRFRASSKRPRAWPRLAQLVLSTLAECHGLGGEADRAQHGSRLGRAGESH